MSRRWVLLTFAAVLSCSGGRATDPAAIPGSFAPRFARWGDRVVLSWVEPGAGGGSTLRFSRREHGSWSPPRSVLRDPDLAADGADVPGVVPLADGGLAAHWTVKRQGSVNARDLWTSVSHDDGVSWSRPVRPHRDDTDSEHAMATILPAANGAGFGICWLDGRAGALADYGEGGTALYWAEWLGDRFAPEIVLDSRVCDCCKTSAAWSQAGPAVAYRDRGDGERRDIAVVRRGDAGWSAPEPVHADDWALNACPTNGPAIVAAGERTAVAWFTGANATPSVWVAASPGRGAPFGPPIRLDGGSPVGRVDATMLPDGSIAVVWLERRGQSADVTVRRVTPAAGPMSAVVVATTSPSRASGYPSLAADGAGDVVVAWTETGATRRVRAARVRLP